MAEARSAQTASEQPAAAGITRPRPGGLDGLVAGVAVAQVVSWGVLYYAFSVLLVPMQQDLGWSRTILIGGFTLAVVVSGLFAPAVGRHLDQGSARLVMSGGSVAGAALVALWSQARTVPTYYAVWVAIGVVMALVLYEPALTVVAKRYAPRHHRPLTAVTLIGGTASLAFQPLTSALASEHGWRGALVILAVILAAVTIPVHLGVLPASTLGESRPHGRRTSQSRPVIDRRFLALTAAFAGASVTSFGASVLLVAYLVDHGWTLGRAAFASGVLGVMQLPGRLLFAPLHHHLSARTLTRLMLGLPGMGVVLLLASGGGALVWAAIPVLGMTQGVNTLLRVTLLVDLYGTARFGALNGRSATPVVLARALAPLGAAFLAAASGGYAVPFLLLAGVAAWASHLGGARL